MARDFNKADPDSITFSGHVGDPTAVTLAGWVDLDSIDSGGGEIISLGDSAVLRAKENLTGFALGFFYNGTDWFNTDGNADIAGAGWKHLAYSVQNGSQALYVGGTANKTTTTHSGSPTYTQGANSKIGGHGNGGTQHDIDGRLAEIGVWNRILTDAEIDQLADGFSPLFIPRGLVFYLPLVRNVQDIKGTALTDNGTTVATHPRIIYPTSPQIMKFETTITPITSRFNIMGTVGM